MRGYAGRLFAMVGLLLAFVVVPASGSAACSCIAEDPAATVARSTVVMVGRLEEVTDPGGHVSPHDVAWKVAVSEVHKGAATATAYVMAQEGCGPTAPEPGRAAVFAAAVQGDRLVIDPCQGVEEPTSTAGVAMLSAAGPASAPVADGSSSASPALPGSTSPLPAGSGLPMPGALLAVAGAVLAGLALRAVIVSRRRRVHAGT